MSKKLLVVEDSKSIAAVIERMGASLGYQVTIANSFAVVKRLLDQGHQFFVATVDYGLPDAPNGEVIPYLLEVGVPSIIMTGRMDDATRKKILNYPIIDYITKENAQAYHYLLRILHGQLHNEKIGVVVVDDSLSARNHTSQLLKRRNFTVYSVDNGTKALKVLETKPNIKILITDQEMPGMDGIELVQKIRKLYSRDELIIIGLSGASRNYQSARFIKNGADDFLRKPFCPEEFYCRIMQHIEKITQTDEGSANTHLDYLTSLHNRRHFLAEATERNKNTQNSDNNHLLVLLAIDKFGQMVNDFGYEATDKVIESFAKLLKENAKNHLLARMEGAEFGVLLSGKELEVLEDLVDKIRVAASSVKVASSAGEIKFTVSGGGILLDSDDTLLNLFQISHQALSQAVNQGGDKICLEGFIDIS